MGVAVGDAPQVWARGHCPPVHKTEREKTWACQLISRASENLDATQGHARLRGRTLRTLGRCICHLQGTGDNPHPSTDRPRHRQGTPCMGMLSSTYKWSGPSRYHYFYHGQGKHIPRKGTVALSDGLVLSQQGTSFSLSTETGHSQRQGSAWPPPLPGLLWDVPCCSAALTELWQPHSIPSAAP